MPAIAHRGFAPRVEQVAADGNCLFNALLDQLTNRRVEPRVAVADQRALRQLVADHMLAHRDDFAPFVVGESDAAAAAPAADELTSYCERLATTAHWGGQLELRAAAAVLDVAIRVHAVDADVLVMGASGDEVSPITCDDVAMALRRASQRRTLDVSYHRRAYVLGEHYNSLRREPPL